MGKMDVFSTIRFNIYQVYTFLLRVLSFLLHLAEWLASEFLLNLTKVLLQEAHLKYLFFDMKKNKNKNKGEKEENNIRGLHF
jgi:hypothetical protein